jgi:5-methyltetrahydrofolate--homocysteine methyltransferase
MTHEEILQGLYDNTLVGNAPEVRDLVNAGLADGMDPENMLYDALIPPASSAATSSSPRC